MQTYIIVNYPLNLFFFPLLLYSTLLSHILFCSKAEGGPISIIYIDNLYKSYKFCNIQDITIIIFNLAN